jgi:signal transduction histidine kinase
MASVSSTLNYQSNSFAGKNQPGEVSSQTTSPESLQAESRLLRAELRALCRQSANQRKQLRTTVNDWQQQFRSIFNGAQHQPAGPDQKQRAHDLEESLDQLRRLASERMLVEQQARGRAAHILHDDLQQLLYSLLVRLELLKLQVAEDPSLAVMEQIQKVAEGITQAIDLTQSLAVELEPPVLEAEGLENGLQWLITHLEEVYHLNIRLSIRARCRLYNPTLQALLLQLVHELLLKVLRQDDRPQLQLELRQEGEGVVIQISEGGREFDLGPGQGWQKPQADFDLFNIKSWLTLIGGRLELDANPGQGMRMTIMVPVG